MVVLDWGWIQALPTGQHHLSNRAAYFILGTVFFELAGKNESQRAGYVQKLQTLVRLNSTNVFVGRFWMELSQHEQDPLEPVDTDQIVNWQLTQTLRDICHADISDMRRGIADQRANSGDYEELRRQFVSWCERFSNLVHQDYATDLQQMTGCLQTQFDWIRRPDRITEFVIQNHGRFDSKGGRRELSRFPDQLAAGRWCRIIAWYGLMHSLGKTASFENNWDDAQYAFLSSYTGWLATDDRRLRETTQAVFPNVRSWSTSNEVGQAETNDELLQ